MNLCRIGSGSPLGAKWVICPVFVALTGVSMSKGKTGCLDWKLVAGVVLAAILVGVALVAVGAVLWEMSRSSARGAPTGIDAANAVSSLVSALGSVGTAWIAYIVFGIAREFDGRRARSSALFVRQALWRLWRNSEVLIRNIEEVKRVNRSPDANWRQELALSASEMSALRDRWGLEAVRDGIDHLNHLDPQTNARMAGVIDDASTIEYALEQLSNFRPATDSTNQDYMLQVELTLGRLLGTLAEILNVPKEVFSPGLAQVVRRSREYDEANVSERKILLAEWSLDYFPTMPSV